MLNFPIDNLNHCRTVASFLRNLLPAATAGYLHKLLKNGHVTLNGAPVQGERLLLSSDLLELKESAKTASLLHNRQGMIDILYEDDFILVANKEPGLAVHLSAEDRDRNLVTLAEAHLSRQGVLCKLRPVNRIDRGTSGGVIMAKSSSSAGMFGRYVKETGLGKIYLAGVRGKVEASGRIDLPLDGKESVTGYRLLFQGEREAIVAVWPVSGRTHQIRRHFSAIGCPILGDRRYGGPAMADYPGHALHAFAVSFSHPASGDSVVIHAPLPAGMIALLERISGQYAQRLLASLAGLPMQQPDC